ncbi:hypothetical protein [Planktothrix agardhii]|jgi:hypothetical protein|uniref:hypothetical protein n=1 Tax=Planktothrix agardhii TaxID=1160 RepID=UPI000DBAF314|nr:hypothetical protein NIES204_25130 [Planktothrix agardhii NIES-204]CAD5932300.1 hypothetical protein NO365_01373 [Planktothrix agardhii]CAD5945793.1 hypothetical protein NO2A_02675 [Planktothrix agardhii]
MGVTRSLLKLTIGTGCMVGGLAFPPLLAADGIVWGTILATALASVAAGNTANAIDALIDRKDGDRISLQNQDLTKAVGKAIAAVITLAALQNQGKTHDNLEKIASQATKFLILGKPGGGKTTTLLELAEALIERAEGDSDAPIPVILELSTWQEVTKRKFLPFGEREKYDPSIHCLDIKLFWQSVSYREYSIC